MKRSGITLLEVLFAIAIAAIGVLGVMATMLLAGRVASEGASADAADRLGRSAVREFHVRCFHEATGPQGTWAAVPVTGQAYCIDPLYVAANGSTSPNCWFPSFDPSVVPGIRLNRISVRPFPGDQATAPVAPIGHAMAESIFLGHDDLQFNLPADRTRPPVQKFEANATARQYAGAYSWLATVQADNYASGPGMLQIAVFRRRDVAEPDRLLAVVPSAITTPELQQVRVAVRPGQPDSDLDVKASTWILLTGTDPSGRGHFGWYRVTDVAGLLQPDASSPTTSRWLGVWGRDWLCPLASTQVAIVGPVVAVYEKRIRICTDSEQPNFRIPYVP